MNNELDLQNAMYAGDLERVRKLLSLVNPKAMDSLALRRAAHNRELEIVRLLEPVSDIRQYL